MENGFSNLPLFDNKNGLRNSFIFLLIIFFNACSVVNTPEDDSMDFDPIEDYKNGIFIVNQGRTQNTDEAGSISFYERESQQVVHDIFLTKNPERHLGNQVYSMQIINNLGYIVAFNSDRIEVVEANTFQSLGSIQGFEKPRYILPVGNNKAYVSQFGFGGVNGSIKIVDLTANSIIDSIPTRPGPDKMLKINDYVYVANTGGFTIDSVLTKIDIQTNHVLKNIDVGINPQGIQIDRNNNLWTISQGTDLFGSRKGQLSRIENDEVILNIEVTKGARNLVISNDKDVLYYTMNNSVFSHTLNQTNITTVPFIDKPFTALAIDPVTNLLMASDAGNFIFEGQVFIYGLNGQEVDQFEAGIAPIGFFFR